MNDRGKHNSRKGQMPMALIAVALLVSSAFFCVVAKSIEDSTDNTESLYDEMGALDEEIDRTKMRIETDLGAIVSDISRQDIVNDRSENASDNLIERAKRFDSICDEMFETAYPSFNRGVTVEIVDHDIWLSMESVRFGTEPDGTGSAFLRAIGSVTANFSTESTSTVRSMDIVADSTSCLPLIVESATEFELSLEGSDSALAQMVDYQLTALAQNRVMNGYGSMNITGYESTDGIITEYDVRKAIRNALDILETMNFRCNHSKDTRLLSETRIDMADYMVAKNGHVEFDIGSFYAQAILSDIDAYALSWMEYVGADAVFNLIDKAWDISREAFDGIIGVFTGRDLGQEKATKYIGDSMSGIGAYNDLESKWYTTSVQIPTMEYSVMIDDEPVIVEVSGSDRTITVCTSKVLDWGGWGEFYKNYNRNTNLLKENLESILKSVANSIQGSCTVMIDVDSFDRHSYLDTVRSSIREMVADCEDVIRNRASRITEGCSITDPLMSAAYLQIRDDRWRIIDNGRFDEAIRNATESNCDWIMESHPELRSISDTVYADLYGHISSGMDRDDYSRFIDHVVADLDSMNRVASDNSSIVIDALGFAIGLVMDGLGLESAVIDSMNELVDAMTESISSEPAFDVIELPNEDRFAITDASYGLHYETMSVNDWSDLDIELVKPFDNRSKNIHYIGFDHLGDTTYSAICDVGVSGTIGFEVVSRNTLAEALGTDDAKYVGECDIDFDLEIPLVSGWELKGVDYRKSNTLVGDVWIFLIEMITPLLDDLMRIYHAFKDLENICSTAMLEFGNKINEMMTMVFEIVSIPLEILTDMLETYFQDLMRNIGLEDLFIGMDSQSFTFRFFDSTVTFETDFKSVFATKKNIVKVTVSKDINGFGTEAFCEISKTGSDEYMILVGGGASGDDWSFNISIDPLLCSRPYYVMIDGNIRDIGYSGTLPEHVQYKRVGLSLGDIPALGKIMDSLPTPIPGVKCSVDAGVYLKCDLRMEDGLLINEVESNPLGNDKGNEWVELYNNTNTTIDLDGYMLIPGSNPNKSHTIEDERIGPKQFLVVRFDDQFLNNKNERLTLYNSMGQIVDVVDSFSDTENNEFTHQRSHDAFTDWGFNKGSPGKGNGDNFTFAEFNSSVLVNYAIDIVPEVFDEMGGNITTTDQMMVFLEKVMAKLVERIIKTIANFIVEAYLFIDIAFEDVSGSLGAGFKVMVGIDSNIVSDTLRYLASMFPLIGEHIENPPGMSMEKILMDDIFLRTIVYTGISTPGFLNLPEEPVDINAGVSLKVNLSAIATLLNSERPNSQWSAEAGILLEDVPYACVPRAFEPEKFYDHDLWLFRMTFKKIPTEVVDPDQD